MGVDGLPGLTAVQGTEQLVLVAKPVPISGRCVLQLLSGLCCALAACLQVALQLAQWMAETGQAANDEIVGAPPFPPAFGLLVCTACIARVCNASSSSETFHPPDPRLSLLPSIAPHALPAFLPACLAPLLAAGLFERATSLEPKSETVLFRYAVYLDEVRGVGR